jgi:hypothetical protein
MPVSEDAQIRLICLPTARFRGLALTLLPVRRFSRWLCGCGGDRGADFLAKLGGGDVAGCLGELASAAGQADLLPAGLAGQQVRLDTAAGTWPHAGQVGRGELLGWWFIAAPRRA